MNDLYNLRRFMEVQDPVFDKVLQELRQGHKRSHWMWFVFPQIRGLGASAMARKFAISSMQEAQAYLTQPILGHRLRECTQLVLNVEGKRAGQIFPHPDDLKFRSCMTLFDCCTANDGLFHQALAQYFNGQPNARTLELLATD